MNNLLSELFLADTHVGPKCDVSLLCGLTNSIYRHYLFYLPNNYVMYEKKLIYSKTKLQLLLLPDYALVSFYLDI